jgi:hypothetical protein
MKKNFLLNCWKLYLDKDKQIIKVKYGTDKTKAQLIYSDGSISSEIFMTGNEYNDKGFASKLLTAAEIKISSEKDIEMQNRMLDDGLFYINKEEGWIEKDAYFKRMTPKDFLEIQDYKDVTVNAVYTDSKNELVFYYTANNKTNTLFTIKASNNQKDRQYPTASGNNIDEKRADTSNLTPYIPGKFPKGTWEITSFEKNGTDEYGPYKIRTDAWRKVEAWEYVYDPILDTKTWRKKIDKDGNIVTVKDEGLLIHGGGYSERSLDNIKGSNKYTDNTLGCIRISNLDVYLITYILQDYIKIRNIELEVI